MTVYKKVYLDTAPIIYFLERVEGQYDAVRDVIYEHIRSGAEFFTSTITNMEYLILPLREGAVQKIADYETFKRLLRLHVLSVDDNVSLLAARLRADYTGLKGMDALQLATSLNAKCDAFVTGDKRLLQVKGINAIVVP